MLAKLFIFIGLTFIFGARGALTGAEGTSVVELKSSELALNATNPEYEVSAVYVYDKEFREKDVHNKFVDLAKKLEGFVLFYSGKCSDLGNFAYCTETDPRPMIVLNRPPEFKVNPYTKKPMETQHMKFNAELLRNATVDQLSNLILSALPDYSMKLDADTVGQLKLMKYFNKVLLFTAKDQSPPILKALSAKYKNRLLV